MTDHQTYCCGRFADKPEEKLSAELFALAKTWYEQHPIAAGCSPRDIKHHASDCRDAIREDYFANAEAIQQRCGFFEPITVISLILTIIRLFYDWMYRADTKPV